MEYDDYVLPIIGDEVNRIDGSHFHPIMRAVDDAFDKGIVASCEARLAYVYERKGFASIDVIPGNRNPSYGSSSDDVIVQISVRIDGERLNRGHGLAMTDEINAILVDDRNAQLEKLKEDAQKAKDAALAAQKNYEDRVAAIEALGGSV